MEELREIIKSESQCNLISIIRKMQELVALIKLEFDKKFHHLTNFILSSLKWNVDSVVDNSENQPFVTQNFFFMRLNCFSENYQAFN